MPPKRKSNHLDEGTSEPKIQRSAYQTRSKTAQELEKKAKPWPTNHKGIPLPIRPCKKRDPTNWEKQIEEFNKAMLALVSLTKLLVARQDS